MYARSFAASLDPPSLQQTKLFQVIQVPYLGDPPIIKTFWLNCLIKHTLIILRRRQALPPTHLMRNPKTRRKARKMKWVSKSTSLLLNLLRKIRSNYFSCEFYSVLQKYLICSYQKIRGDTRVASLLLVDTMRRMCIIILGDKGNNKNKCIHLWSQHDSLLTVWLHIDLNENTFLSFLGFFCKAKYVIGC